MRAIKFDQQAIVFGLFVVVFAIFSLFLPNFFSVGNVVTLLRTVSFSVSSASAWRSW